MSIASVNASANLLPLIGDVNGDGQVTITDVVKTIYFILGNSSSDFDFAAADVNGDGEITITDVGSIINTVLEKDKVTAIDTIKVIFQDNQVFIYGNFDENYLHASVSGAKVKVKSSGKKPFACFVEGESTNGSLVVDADTTCSLIMNNLQLTSLESAAINFPKKQKVNIELSKGSQNVLCDASSREENDGANACLYSKGTLAFTGKGMLSVSGNYGHGIASSKNISIDGSSIVIADVVKNGIHCDRFTLKKGQVDLRLQNEASKGIKAKEEIVIKDGSIEGEATGGIINNNGDLSYCSLLKSDGSMMVSGGSLTLIQSGDGGRCISVDKDFTITGGSLNLKCFGDGGQYINTENEHDYYTPKCITVDDSLYITEGVVYCTSTGLGGKGIVADKFLAIGVEGEQERPLIRVETKGECIINNEDEDLRFGCPKGIKANDELYIYGGDIAVTTVGMGGEGVECNGDMYILGGTLECNTFDDGINVGHAIEIFGGCVYCNSVDNDGIDSNGSIIISNGIVASINQKKPNESFDSRNAHFYLYGGTIFGIGSRPVEIGETIVPLYNTSNSLSTDGYSSLGLLLKSGKYVYLQKCNEIVFALRNENQERRVFLTITNPNNIENQTYTIAYGDCPLGEYKSLFDGKFIVGGIPFNSFPIIDAQM
jgi:hypothetical protein